MPSKMVTDRQKSAAAIEAAIATHAEEAAAALTATLAPVLGDAETPVDVVPLQAQFGRLLERRRDVLVRMDEAHLAELGDDVGPRRRRDDAAQRLSQQVVAIRQTLSALFGPDATQTLVAIDGRTATDPVTLARQGRRMLERFTDPAFALPEAQFAGVDLDVTRWVDELAAPVEELEAALDEVARERREAETTLTAKLLALDDYDRSYRAVARILEGLYELTGLDEYASRVRPTARGGGAAATPEGPPAAPVPEEGTEAAALEEAPVGS